MKHTQYLFLQITAIFLLSTSNAQALSSDDKNEIALSSEAAPMQITANASFMRFVDGQFHLIKKGENNFTCLVIRNPKGRFEPSCFNEQAMRSVFYTYELEMQLLFSGKSYDETYNAIELAFNQGRLPTAEIGSLVYMMSPNNKTYRHKEDELVTTPVHQMYYFPKLDNSVFSLSSNQPLLWQGYPHLSALIVKIETK